MESKPSVGTKEKKVAIVTGGNRGLGLGTATKIAAEGYHVIIACRDVRAGNEAADAIRRDVPKANVEAMRLDLASLASVREFAEAYRARGLPLHLLVNNAGLIAFEKAEKSTDGYEMQFATNHLGHFLLTTLLEDVLVRSAPARVVVVSSQMHKPKFGPGKGPDFRWENVDAHEYYEAMTFYRNSKLANMWFTYALSRRLADKGVTVNALCPGFVPATGVAAAKGFNWFLFRFVFPLMPQSRTIDVATTHMAWVATSPALEGVTGKFYTDSKEITSSEESLEVSKQERLWTESLAMIARAAKPIAVDAKAKNSEAVRPS